MRYVRHTIWIASTPEQVFDFFVDFPQSPRWRSYVRTMERLDEGPLREGSRLHVVMDVMGESYEFDMEVLACERPRLWRHRTNEGDLRGYVEYRFEPAEGGTTVSMTIVVHPDGIFGWLAMPLMLLQRNKPYAEQLPKLKRALEGGGPS